jgi:hypothetical protein
MKYEAASWRSLILIALAVLAALAVLNALLVAHRWQVAN